MCRVIHRDLFAFFFMQISSWTSIICWRYSPILWFGIFSQKFKCSELCRFMSGSLIQFHWYTCLYINTMQFLVLLTCITPLDQGLWYMKIFLYSSGSIWQSLSFVSPYDIEHCTLRSVKCYVGILMGLYWIFWEVHLLHYVNFWAKEIFLSSNLFLNLFPYKRKVLLKQVFHPLG